MQDAAAVRRTLESFLSSDIYYINLEDEPTVFCENRTNNTVNFKRLVRLKFSGKHSNGRVDITLYFRLM